MEGSVNPDCVAPGLARTSTVPGPLLPDPVEELHGQTDSYLTAARLLRRGWTEEEAKRTEWQFSRFDVTPRQTPPFSRPDGTPAPRRCAEYSPKNPDRGLVPSVNSRKSPEGGETSSGKKADEATQTTEGAFTGNGQRDVQTRLRQAGIVRVWKSSCRTTCRQSRRFKAPILPVIAEM